MPELPEVEIVKQSLLKNINNKIIKKVKIYNSNLRFKLPYNFCSVLICSVVVCWSVCYTPISHFHAFPRDQTIRLRTFCLRQERTVLPKFKYPTICSVGTMSMMTPLPRNP